MPHPHTLSSCLALAIVLLVGAARGTATEVLFVGNSFTHGNVAVVMNYNKAAVTDINGTNWGGVPAIFKKFADETGHSDVNVTIQASSGMPLSWHVINKYAVFDHAWDVVVLQDVSTKPLITFTGSPPGDVPGFRRSVQDILAVLKARNPAVRVYLFETWARPNLVPGAYSTLQAMQSELHASYFAAAADFALAGCVPVGDAFMSALNLGVAYDPNQGPAAGRINLWDTDSYHASAYGSYLAALLFYKNILGGDPRTLSTGPGSAVAVLGLSAASAAALQQLAHDSAGSLYILTSPASLSRFPGSSARFTVTASGASAYQWRKNGAALPGRTASTLDLANLTADDAGRYDVLVSGANGQSLVSEPATLAVTTHETSRQVFIDLGSSGSGFPTASPDAAGRAWNQITASNSGTTLSTINDQTGTIVPGLALAVTASFSGVNTGGINTAGTYPGTAQRDSFYVTGSGSVGSARRGQLTLSGFAPATSVTLRLFGSRDLAGARVTRFTAGDAAPVFLDAAANRTNTVALGPVSADANGNLVLVVEPYDSAGTLQEYGYLGVIELSISTPAPTAYEQWSAASGLAASLAGVEIDADGDGISNLIEFTLGSDPTDAASRRQPAVDIVDSADSLRYLALDVSKNPSANSILKVEVSGDLSAWFTGPGHTVTLTDTAERLLVRDAIPLTAASHRFLRLTAQLP